jgi:hypothetical protein
VIIGNMMAARIGDNTAHGGVIVVGCPTVMIGDSGSGGAGGAGGNGGAGAVVASPAPAVAAFKNAAATGAALVCKGPCAACGHM